MKRLGLLLPSSGTVPEADFCRRVPEDVTVHAARMPLTEASEAAKVRTLDEHVMPAGAREVPEPR
jgi:maleate cis-trans isomerase